MRLHNAILLVMAAGAAGIFSAWALLPRSAADDASSPRAVASSAPHGSDASASQPIAARPQAIHPPPLNIKTLSDPAKQSVMARSLEMGQSLNMAMREGIARYGDHDGRVAALANEADWVCNENIDAYGSLDSRNGDPTRVWAIEQVVDLCQGFNRKRFKLHPPKQHSAASALVRLGDQAALAAANETIADGWNKTSLAEAGVFLLSTHRFPFNDVAPGADRQFGLIDLEAAWYLASDLALCGQIGGCGPKSLLVAAYCRQHGCMPGSNLVQAYERNLSPDKFQLVMAFASWIQRQRVQISR